MAPSAQLTAFVDFEIQIANGPYVYSQAGGRCDPLNSGHADCSGLVCASLNHVGVAEPCTGSFALAIECHRAGTGIPISQARTTRGALLFIGINEGQGGIPGVDEGHVATSCGDGTAVQALNSNAGIGIWPFDMLTWSYAAMPCWFPTTGTPPPPPPPPPPAPKVKRTMIFYTIPDHPNPAARGTVWMTDGFFYRGMHTPQELHTWQFIAATQGVPNTTTIGKLSWADAQWIAQAK